MSNNKKTILLVEDDGFLAELYMTKLSMDSFNVILATDGKKGLKLAQEKLPDLILLDIILPKMDGFEVLKSLKSNNKTKNISVVLLTNLSQREDVKKGLKLGAEDYLIKAYFMPSEILAKVKKIARKNV